MTDYKTLQFRRQSAYHEDFASPLWQQLLDIAHNDLHEAALDRHKLPTGPNDWANITDADFGREYDFEILDQVDRFIIWPDSNAALQWCYCHLPEDCPRWGAKGFVINASMNSYRGAQILQAMQRARLVSEDEALANEERDRRSGE